MGIMEFVKTKEIKDIIERGKEYALWRCTTQGHDYRKVSGIDNGKICICCGGRPNQPLNSDGKKG